MTRILRTKARKWCAADDWWSVRVNGEFALAQPSPVFQFLEASSFKVFVIHDAAAKFPSALLGFATLMYFPTLELTRDS
jgi:hypothetical protein